MRCLLISALLLAGCASPQEIDKMEERWHEDRKVDARLFHKAETVPLLEANHRKALEAVAVLGVTIDSRIEASETTTEGLLDTAFHHARDERVGMTAARVSADSDIHARIGRHADEYNQDRKEIRREISEAEGRGRGMASTIQSSMASLKSLMVGVMASVGGYEVKLAQHRLTISRLQDDLKTERKERLSSHANLFDAVQADSRAYLKELAAWFIGIVGSLAIAFVAFAKLVSWIKTPSK